MQVSIPYAFESARDIYEKVKRDAARLDREITGDDVFNFCVIANSLMDWLCKTSGEPQVDVDQLRGSREPRCCSFPAMASSATAVVGSVWRTGRCYDVAINIYVWQSVGES